VIVLKKSLAALIYALMIFPITALTIITEMLAREAGILGAYQNVIDLHTFLIFAFSAILFGIPIFYWINQLLNKFEWASRNESAFPRITFLAVLSFICMITWGINGFHNSEADGYLMIWMGISLIGIVINRYFQHQEKDL